MNNSEKYCMDATPGACAKSLQLKCGCQDQKIKKGRIPDQSQSQEFRIEHDQQRKDESYCAR